MAMNYFNISRVGLRSFRIRQHGAPGGDGLAQEIVAVEDVLAKGRTV